jgi:hypothetical protein
MHKGRQCAHEKNNNQIRHGALERCTPEAALGTMGAVSNPENAPVGFPVPLARGFQITVVVSREGLVCAEVALALIACLPPHHGPPPMQRISESAESLFGDLHKPFSTASVKSGKAQIEHMFSGLPLATDIRARRMASGR